jgi:hypothetical protein
MITVDYNTAHSIVEKNISLSWDGWKIVDFKKDFKAEFSNDGIRLNGSWGFYRTYELDRDGWKVPQKYVK